MIKQPSPMKRLFDAISYIGLNRDGFTDIFGKGKILCNQVVIIFLSVNFSIALFSIFYFRLFFHSVYYAVVFYSVLAVVYAAVWLINKTGRHYLGGVIITIASLMDVVFNSIHFGNVFSIEYYIVILMILPFLIFPKSLMRIIVLLEAADIATVIWAHLRFHESQPLIQIPQEHLIYFQLISYFFFALMVVFMIVYLYNATDRAETALSKEIERSDNLLANILPRKSIEELKEKGSVTPAFYESASVLFTDFKGFTMIAESMTPQELVQELDKCFSYFDSVCEKYGLEKLKTIGDSYMCAGGIPESNATHPLDCVLAAMEIQSFMKVMKDIKASLGLPYWELRLGIHTGPIVAGVIGSKKFAYDIWGDTVNTASRMESSGLPGAVNISEATYDAVKKWFVCEHRGKVKAKNKGEMDMYSVTGLKPEYLTNDVPNEKFKMDYESLKLS